jgi:hypothetical protein
MGQKIEQAFNHAEKTHFFKQSSRVYLLRGGYDLDELCAVAHLGDAVDGMRKNRVQ